MNEEKGINIVSYGGGQNSTAMIIEMIKDNQKIDEVIFSDTKREMPETYEFLKEFEPYLKKKKVKFTKIKSWKGDIREYYYKEKRIPYKMFRHCTGDFKIKPINNYIKEKYGIKKPINMFIGIGIDEKRRAKFIGRKQFTYKYPLIEKNIDREKCIEIIKSEGLSVPVKSGCYFCPFQTKKAWRQLWKKHPELFKDSKDFEKNCSAYPQGCLTADITLEDLEKQFKEQKVLFNDTKGVTQCPFCHT